MKSTGAPHRTAFSILFMFGALSGCAFNGGSGRMTIVENGRPSASIVVSEKADEVVVDAAEELQTYIRKISGAKLPIVHDTGASGNLILVGRMPEVDRLVPDLDELDLGPDGIVLRSLPCKLIITGQNDGYVSPHSGRADCGTPNAVYTLLDLLGCRWYMPGEDGEYVPARRTITIDALDIVHKPAFESRLIGRGAVWRVGGEDPQSKVYRDYMRWLARNREGRNAYHNGHTLRHLLPRSLGPAHPEYFALVDGRRRYDHESNICTSNAEVIDRVTASLVGELNKGPWRSYAVSHYDAWLWCACDECLRQYGDKTFVYRDQAEARPVAQTPGDTVHPNVANGTLKFVNTIAERIEKTHPDTTINYYALYNMPGFPEATPRDNVVPMMCHINPRDAAWRRQVDDWAPISRRLMYYGYMGYRIAFPKLNMAEDITWCHGRRGIGMYLEVDEYSPINTVPLYLAARAMWDTQTDAQAVLDEFYRRHYGRASAAVRRFFEAFHAATVEALRESDTHADYPEQVTRDLVAECRCRLEEAMARAERAVVKRRIESLRRYWRIVDLEIAARDAMAAWKADPSDANRNAARAAAASTSDAIQAAAGEFYMQARSSRFRRWRRALTPRPVALDGPVLLDLPLRWLFRTDPGNIGESMRWFEPATDLAAFRSIATGSHWEAQWVGPYDGYGWYLVDIEIPATDAAHVWLLFGAVDETWKLWIDGRYIGASTGDPGDIWNQPAAIEITGRYRPGTMVRLAVKVHDSRGAGGVWKPVKITTRP